MADTYASRKIKKILKRKNMTLYVLADACGITRQTLYYYVNSDKRTSTSFENMCKIAKYLNVDINEFNEYYESIPRKEYSSIAELEKDLAIDIEHDIAEDADFSECEVIYCE